MGALEAQSQDTASTMKYLWVLVLFSVAFADPEADSDPKADADPYLLYGGYYGRGLGHYGGYYGYGLGYGYGHGGHLWGRKKRGAEAAPTAAADPNAEADPYLLYGRYYGHGLGHYGGYYGYGLGYGYGHGGYLWGRKK